MRNYFLHNKLEDDTWYGFLSPKFTLKTSLNSESVLKFIHHFDRDADVVLFSSDWDQIAYFLNPLEQGEFFHPGLLAHASAFLEYAGSPLDPSRWVAHSQSTVSCNYLVAKPKFWRAWLQLAEQLFQFVEGGRSNLAKSLAQDVPYLSANQLVQMKVFIQERLASIILGCTPLRVANIDLSSFFPVFEGLFFEDARSRGLLKACDTLKQEYVQTADLEYLRMYRKIRVSLPTKVAIPMPAWPAA